MSRLQDNSWNGFGTNATKNLTGGNPVSLTDVLSGLASQFGIGRKREDDELGDFWRNVAGDLAEYSAVSGVRRKVLEIMVSDAIFVQEFMFRKVELLQKLQEHFPKDDFQNIRFRIGCVNENTL